MGCPHATIVFDRVTTPTIVSSSPVEERITPAAAAAAADWLVDRSYLLRQERDDLSTDSVQPLGNLRLQPATQLTCTVHATSILRCKLHMFLHV